MAAPPHVWLRAGHPTSQDCPKQWSSVCRVSAGVPTPGLAPNGASSSLRGHCLLVPCCWTFWKDLCGNSVSHAFTGLPRLEGPLCFQETQVSPWA